MQDKKKSKGVFYIIYILFFIILIIIDHSSKQQIKEINKLNKRAETLINQYNNNCNEFNNHLNLKYSEKRYSLYSNNTIEETNTYMYEEINVPNYIDTSFKAYMDYRTLSNITSKQYEIQQQAYTDSLGFRRIGQDYLIALGTFYSNNCGDRFLITLDSGVSFTVMIGDIKMNKHTNETNQYTPMKNGNANLVEFIVDTKKMEKNILKLGDISNLGFKGNVFRIQKIIN